MGIRSNFCDCAASSKNGLREQLAFRIDILSFCSLIWQSVIPAFPRIVSTGPRPGQVAKNAFSRGMRKSKIQQTDRLAFMLPRLRAVLRGNSHGVKAGKGFFRQNDFWDLYAKKLKADEKTMLKPAWKISSPGKKISSLGISFSGLGFFRPDPEFSHTASRKKQNTLWFFAQKTRFVQKNRAIFLYSEAKRQKSGMENHSKNNTLPDFSPVR